MKYSRKTLFCLENKNTVLMIFSLKVPCIYTNTISLVPYSRNHLYCCYPYTDDKMT